MRMDRFITGASAALVIGFPLSGQEAKSAEDELLALLNTPITVASKKASTIREQPGIVSLVSRQEIQATGARDLLDILQNVPGFAFGKDVQGSVGAGIRGLWGYEGKILLLIDGQEINDPLYRIPQFGNHIPADIIQRVEIIRGPGSAIYGGCAELAVINVVTRTANDIKDFSFAQSLGRIEGTEGRKTSALSVASFFDNGKFSLTMSSMAAPRSNEHYYDSIGGGFDMARQSDIKSVFGSLGVEYYGYKFRVLMDRHSIEQREHFWVDTVPVPFTQTWDNYYFDLKKTFQLGTKFTLTPNVQFRRQNPWGATPNPVASDSYSFFYSNKRVDRTVGSLQLTYDPNDDLSILSGIEYYKQDGKANLAWNPFRNRYDGYFKRTSDGGITEVNYNGMAYFGQGLLKTSVVDIVVGARYETHSLFESSFVPRVGFTKVIDKFHFKALWSKAFRSPNLQTTAINPDLKPEKTTAMELEAGYQLSKTSFVVVNLFDTKVERPIIYYVLAGDDAYDNFERMGSRGAEVEYRLQHGLGQLTFNYSYYQNQDTKVPLYQVAGKDKSLLAFPQHKLVLNSTFRMGEHWQLYGGLVYLGDRYGWDYDPNAPEIPDVNSGFRVSQKKFEPTTLATVVLTYKGLHPGFDISLGAYNLFKKKFSYIEAYGYKQDNLITGFQPPIPGQSQEFVLKASYSF